MDLEVISEQQDDCKETSSLQYTDSTENIFNSDFNSTQSCEDCLENRNKTSSECARSYESEEQVVLSENPIVIPDISDKSATDCKNVFISKKSISNSLYGEDDPVTETFMSIYSGSPKEMCDNVNITSNRDDTGTQDLSKPIPSIPSKPDNSITVEKIESSSPPHKSSPSMLPSILNRNKISSPAKQTAVLGREQIKKRLHSFSLMKQGIHATPIKKILNLKQPKVQVHIGVEEYDENGEKIDDKIVFVKKPPKKGPCPQEKAKAVINEIEQLKREEAAFLEKDSIFKHGPLASTPKVRSSRTLLKGSPSTDNTSNSKKPKSAEDIVEKSNDDSRHSSKDYNKQVDSRKDKKDRKYRSRRSLEREKKNEKDDDRMPANWNKFKEDNFDFKRISKIKQRTHKSSNEPRIYDKYEKKMNDRQRAQENNKEINKKEFKIQSSFDSPALPRYPFIARSLQGQNKAYPQETVRYTERHPVITYCENTSYARGYFPTRKQLCSEIPPDRLEHFNKIIEQKPKSNIPGSNAKSQKWYPKINFLVEDKYLENQGIMSYGLSVLSKSYNDDQDDVIQENESTTEKLNTAEIKTSDAVTNQDLNITPVKNENEKRTNERKIEENVDATPNTEEYRSNWESEEDNMSGIISDSEHGYKNDKKKYSEKQWNSVNKDERCEINKSYNKYINKKRGSEDYEHCKEKDKQVDKDQKWYESKDHSKKLNVSGNSNKKDYTPISEVNKSFRRSASLEHTHTRKSNKDDEDKRKYDKQTDYIDNKRMSVIEEHAYKEHNKSLDKSTSGKAWSREDSEQKKHDKTFEKRRSSSDDYPFSEHNRLYNKSTPCRRQGTEEIEADKKRKSDKFIENKRKMSSSDEFDKSFMKRGNDKKYYRSSEEVQRKKLDKLPDQRKTISSLDDSDIHQESSEKFSKSSERYDKNLENKYIPEEFKEDLKKSNKDDTSDVDEMLRSSKEMKKDERDHEIFEKHEHWSSEEETHNKCVEKDKKMEQKDDKKSKYEPDEDGIEKISKHMLEDNISEKSIKKDNNKKKWSEEDDSDIDDDSSNDKSKKKKNNKKEELKNKSKYNKKGHSSSEDEMKSPKKNQQEKQNKQPKVNIDFNDFEKNSEDETFLQDKQTKIIINNDIVHELDQFPKYRSKIKIDYSDFEQSFLENEMKMEKKIVSYVDDIQLSQTIETMEKVLENKTIDKISIEQPIADVKLTRMPQIVPVAPPMIPMPPVASPIVENTSSKLVSEYEEFMKALCCDETQEKGTSVATADFETTDHTEITIDNSEQQELNNIKIPEDVLERKLDVKEQKIKSTISGCVSTENDKGTSDSDLDSSSVYSSSSNSNSTSSKQSNNSGNRLEEDNLVKVKVEKLSDTENEKLNSHNVTEKQKRKVFPKSNSSESESDDKIIKRQKRDRLDEIKLPEEQINESKYSRDKDWESDNSLTHNSALFKENTGIINQCLVNKEVEDLERFTPLKYPIIDLAEIMVPTILPENIPLPNDITESPAMHITPKPPPEPIFKISQFETQVTPTKKSAVLIPIKLLSAETRKQANETPKLMNEEVQILGNFTPIDLKFPPGDNEKKISSLYESLPNIELRSDLIPTRKRSSQLTLNISPIKKPFLETIKKEHSDSDSDTDFTDRFIKQAECKKIIKEDVKKTEEKIKIKIQDTNIEPSVSEVREGIKVEVKQEDNIKQLEENKKNKDLMDRHSPEHTEKYEVKSDKYNSTPRPDKGKSNCDRKDNDKSRDSSMEYKQDRYRDRSRKEHVRDKDSSRDRDSMRDKEFTKGREYIRDRDRDHMKDRERESLKDRESTRNRDPVRDKERDRDFPRDKDSIKDREYPKDKESIRDRESMRDREPMRDRESFRDREPLKDRESARDSRETVRDRDSMRDRDYLRDRDIIKDRSLRDRDSVKDRDRDYLRDRESARDRESIKDRESTRDKETRDSNRDRDNRKSDDRRPSSAKPRDRYSRNSRERDIDRYRSRDRSKEKSKYKDYDRERECKRDEQKQSRSMSQDKDRNTFQISTISQDDTDFSTTNMDIVQSPVNSPLDGFKRSLADSTISDSELLMQKTARDESIEPSPKYNTPYYPPTSGEPKRLESPSSPKRISLDDRINLVLGIEKEPPKPIESVCSRGQYTEYQPNYEQYGYGKNEYEAYSAAQTDNYVSPYTNQYQSRYYNHAQNTSSNIKVVQVGNVIQVVPNDKPVLPTIPPVVKVNEPHPKVVQVGNVLQIVPIPIVENITSKVTVLPPSTAPPAAVEPPLPAIKTVEQIIQERRAEKEKRRQEREQRRKEKEKKRKEKEKRKQLKIQLKTENMIKRALSLETGEGDLDTSNLENEIPEIVDMTNATWPPISSVVLPLPTPPSKGILVSSGFRASNVVESHEEQPEIRKVVKFADGICPGEGTSPSGGEELPSPPPPPKKLPKEKRYKKVKNKNKKKVKVKIIRTQPATEEDDSEDNLPPPPPPPGSPPPHLWPPRIKPINNIHPSIPSSVFPPNPFQQTVLYPPAYSQNMPVVMHPPSHGPPPPPPPQVPRHHPPVIPMVQSGAPHITPNQPGAHHGPPFHH